MQKVPVMFRLPGGAGINLTSPYRRGSSNMSTTVTFIACTGHKLGDFGSCIASTGHALARQQHRSSISRSTRTYCASAAMESQKPTLDGVGEAALSKDFSNSNLERFAVGVLGDLHLEPNQMALFGKAADQMRKSLHNAAGQSGSRVVQLGDLGGYQHQPGSRQCFRVASKYLHSFGLPVALVTGNHDLEGDEFATDELNLRAWQEVFGQRHFWAAELGPALCLGLSTVRFRSNKHSAHEVFVDDEQLAWFEERLARSQGRPVIVFTHAPPLGSGLKVVEGVHVKNRCAWLNHSSDPEVFLGLVRRHHNIKLWFSGHYHLSQSYPNSISTVGGCAFVQTGVIGECDRDGLHQSRILTGDQTGYKVLTLNHGSGEERLDLQQTWDGPAPQTGWLATPPKCWWPAALAFHQDSLAEESGLGAVPKAGDQWWGGGKDLVLRRMGNLLIEYKASYRAAVGAVFTDIDPSWAVRLVDAEGRAVQSQAGSSNAPSEDGSSAHAIELVDSRGRVQRSVPRNAEGGFFQVFQKNKWRARQRQREAAAL